MSWISSGRSRFLLSHALIDTTQYTHIRSVRTLSIRGSQSQSKHAHVPCKNKQVTGTPYTTTEASAGRACHDCNVHVRLPSCPPYSNFSKYVWDSTAAYICTSAHCGAFTPAVRFLNSDHSGLPAPNLFPQKNWVIVQSQTFSTSTFYSASMNEELTSSAPRLVCSDARASAFS